MYLESSSKTNLPYYKKYGFEEKVDIQLERGPKPVKMHIMVREPKVVAESSKKVLDQQQTVKIRTLA
jgi:hypothetical protein